LIGIILGIKTLSYKEMSDNGLWDFLNYIGIIGKPYIETSWISIAIHNLFLSLKVGFLGLISDGIFTFPYLLSWWSLWTRLITKEPIYKIFFVIPEAIGITSIVILSVYIGLNYFIYKSIPKYQIILFFVGILLILVGGVIESYEISSFIK